ncbi:30S ribosomal protein S27e [Candidatus Woesearchaeota archaeon]|nr:30S ribosomal protein S27e [Candidatus Woesearchaeota archaeon]
MIKETNNKFVKLRCAKCKNEQVTYNRVSTVVKCLVCNEVMAQPTGGKSAINARILEVLE